jgi:putative membrane protein
MWASPNPGADPMLPNYLQAMPQFLMYLGLGALLLGVFWSLYTWLTSHDEMALIRAGNSSAALMLIGALIGFLLPLCNAIAQRTTAMALIQWAVLAMLIQLGVYALLRLIWPSLHQAIEEDRVSMALLAGFLSVAAGWINSAAMP